jgi:hypothetical protein
MEVDGNHQPIFVVGASRSGTELMRSVLNQHPSVCISPETHYFDDLRVRLRGHEHHGLTDKEAQQCENYFRAVMHRPYGHGGEPGSSPLSRRALREMAATIGTGADAFFEGFCRLDAGQKRAARWGEKTPRHIFCLPEIFRAFPRARVICMVRDPRGVIASYRDWKNSGGFNFEKDPGHRATLEQEAQRVRRSYNILIACLLWSGSVRAAIDGRKRFTPDRVLIQRYEDLVSNSESTLDALTSWLSLDLHPAMLNVPVTNSSFTNFERSAGFAKQFIDRWRTKLNQHEIGVIQTSCARLMRYTHYELDPVGTPLRPFFWECLKLPGATINAAAANRSRIGALGPYLYRRMRFAIGGMLGVEP